MTPKMHKFLRKLKRDFPLRKPVRVRTYKNLTCEGYKIYGSFRDNGDTYEISIARHEDESIMIDTLFHEWCHAMLSPKCTVRHTDLFFKTYGQVYRHYLD